MLYSTTRRLTGLGPVVAGLLLLALGLTAWVGLAPVPKTRIQLGTFTDASPTTEFVAALARGDEAGAEQVASPLYHAEWARRGLSIEDREAIAGGPPLEPSATADRLSFTYVGSVEDAAGFRHVLYLARPAGAGPDASPSVWRIDTDAQGQVIWAELVYLFDASSSSFQPVGAGDAVPGLDLPGDLAAGDARVAMGVRSTVGREGYYALIARRSSSSRTASGSDRAIVFLAVDTEGAIRPGVWSYGQSVTVLAPYGKMAPPPAISFDARLAALQQSYLATLCGAC